MNKLALSSLTIISTLSLAACSTNGNYVPRNSSHKTLSYGSVTAKEEITIGGSNSGIGAYVGSAAAIHNSTSNSFIGFIVRGIAGSIAGSAIEEVSTRKNGTLYTIETSQGNIIEVASTVKDLNLGACVLISNAGRQRVKVKQASPTNCRNNHNSASSSATN